VKPLLFLDVDGVLNPYPGTPEGYVEHAIFPGEEPVRVLAAHSGWLAELGGAFELVWATGWGDEANEHLCALLGLAPLPVVRFPPVPFEPHEKVAPIAAWAGQRPAAWVDDLVGREARAWAAAREAPTLLVEVDHAAGLDRPQVDRLLLWARALPT
jgi:hypothetical protein